MKKNIWLVALAAVSASMITVGFTDINISRAQAKTAPIVKEIANGKDSGKAVQEDNATVITVCPLPTKNSTSEKIEEEKPALPAYTVEEMSAVKYANTVSNIRKGPSTDYEIIGGANLNEALEITGRADTGWYRVNKGGVEGFISPGLVNDEPVSVPAEPEPAPVNPDPSPAEPEPAPVNPYEGMETHLWDFTEEEIISYIVNTYTTQDMSPFDKAVALNNYLCDTMEYDDTHTHRSTYDAIAYGTGVCQGYANAYKKLMCAAGVETDFISGIGYTSTGGGSHGWNRSLIDGVYYYTDVTWNDCLSENRYLLISYDEMSRDHAQQAVNPYRIE